MSIKLYASHTKNLGDLFNTLPVISGLAESFNDKVKFVVPDEMQQIKGFKEFLMYQGIFESIHYRCEIIGMEENQYIRMVYSQDEMRNLTERPNRPIETSRHEAFIRAYHPTLGEWEVDDDFKLNVFGVDRCDEGWICGDRWLKSATDTRRASNVLKDSGLFDGIHYRFLDYTKPIMDNAREIASCKHPFIGTFTGSSVIADLLDIEHYVLWDDSMIGWNAGINSDKWSIDYSLWKHYYKNRKAKLYHIDEFKYVMNE